MKAFWWFEENKVAGMARPGFNHCQWFDLPFEEAMLMGWLGQSSSGTLPLHSFWRHLDHYLPKAAPFYEIDEVGQQRHRDRFDDPVSLRSTLEALALRSRFLESATVVDDHVHFKIHEDQLRLEIESLRRQGIRQIVSLTEDHHAKEVLGDHFELHHLSIVDMGAPTREQAQQLLEILENAERKQEKIAVHCLAGIGRTSTLLMASQLLKGETLPSLLDRLARQNPSYKFVGAQAEFIRSLVASLTDRAQ